MKKLFFICLVALASGCSKKSTSPDTSGIISTYAGNGTSGYSGDGGLATIAEIEPGSLSLDNSGSLYFTDGLHIRKVATDGIISTIAGNGASSYYVDGVAAFNTGMTPTSIFFDKSGNLYFVDVDDFSVQKINTAGIVSTIAGGLGEGSSGDGGPATAAKLYKPTCVVVDGSQNVFIADFFAARIRKVNAAGIISTVAGNGTIGFSGDGGSATDAEIAPGSIVLDQAGDIYMTDGSHVRKIDTAGIITTIGGNGGTGTTGDGGPATAASFASFGLAMDNTNNIYITDNINYRVRKINSAGIISTFAGGGTSGMGDGKQAIYSEMNPVGITLDNTGNVFISDGYYNRIRKVSK